MDSWIHGIDNWIEKDTFCVEPHFVIHQTHEIHANWYPTNNDIFTVIEHKQNSFDSKFQKLWFYASAGLIFVSFVEKGKHNLFWRYQWDTYLPRVTCYLVSFHSLLLGCFLFLSTNSFINMIYQKKKTNVLNNSCVIHKSMFWMYFDILYTLLV